MPRYDQVWIGLEERQTHSCYPELNEQTLYAEDKNGAYPPKLCNHYNLLKLIEAHWSLRGLVDTDTSAGYKYALPLTTITGWMKS